MGALHAELAELAKRAVARAVLFDRDGTLIVDVPFNSEPSRVRTMQDARRALDRLRAAGINTGLITNQSAVALGHVRYADVLAVNARVEQLLGPLWPVLVCVHGETDGCACRKPAPGMIADAARMLDVEPGDCVVIGDIGSDVEAARAAGARSVLVPTPRTLAAEIASAALVVADLSQAVDAVLNGAA